MYTFSGIVVNVTIATCTHRDQDDEEFCLVITIWDVLWFYINLVLLYNQAMEIV